METYSLQLIAEKILKSKLLFGLVIFVFCVKILISFAFVSISGNVFFADIAKSELVNMINQTRQSFGLNALSENEQLDYAAELKAEDMLANGYFDHISPSGITPWHWISAAGYNYKYAGENLAIGFYESGEVYQAWLNSVSHKENIISPYYTEVGTAVLRGFGGNKAIVVVQLFGKQETNASVIPAATKKTEEVIEIQPTIVGNSQEILTEAAETSETKVLSSSIVLKTDDNSGIERKFLSFILTNYQNLLQYVIYGMLVVITGIFIYSLSLNFNKQINDGLVVKSLVMIAISFFSVVISPELIALCFPHQIII